MAGSALDCDRIFAVISGFDEQDPTSADYPLENFLPRLGDGIQGLRVGVPRNYYLDGCSSDVATAYQAALKKLDSLGARLVDVTVAGAEGIQAETSVMIFSDAAHLHADRLKDEARWGATKLERLKAGLAFSGRDYARSMRARESWKRTVARLYREIDVLATPTIVDEPPPIEDGLSLYKTTMSVTKNTYGGAFAGVPGISVPNGVSRGGLPITLRALSRSFVAAPTFVTCVLWLVRAGQHLGYWHFAPG